MSFFDWLFPKAPEPQKINPYEGLTSDARFAEAAKQLGYNTVNKDHEVRNVRRVLLQQDFEYNRKDPTFLKAELQLLKEGRLTGAVNTGHYGKKTSQLDEAAKAFRQQYRKREGTSKGWERSYAYQDFDYSDSQDLQRVYDRVAAIQGKKIGRQNKKELNKQQSDYIKSQESQAEAQRKTLEELTKQPTYSPQQAAIPPVQYKARTPAPIPVAPAPPPAMAISPTPMPVFTRSNNYMPRIRQSSTTRERSNRRTRGTATLMI